MLALLILIFLTGENNFDILQMLNNLIPCYYRQADCMKLGSEGVQIVPAGTSHPGVNPGTVINAGTDAEIDAGGPDEIENYDEIVG